MAQRVFWCACLFALLSMLSGCGNKGPLFLPDDELPPTELSAEPDAATGATADDVEPSGDAVVDEALIDGADTNPTDDEQKLKKSSQRQ